MNKKYMNNLITLHHSPTKMRSMMHQGNLKFPLVFTKVFRLLVSQISSSNCQIGWCYSQPDWLGFPVVYLVYFRAASLILRELHWVLAASLGFLEFVEFSGDCQIFFWYRSFVCSFVRIRLCTQLLRFAEIRRS